MEETNGILDSDDTFPAVDVNRELNPGQNKNFEVDPVSSQVAATKEIQEQTEAAKTQNEREKKDPLQTLKSAIIVSAVAVAVAVAVAGAGAGAGAGAIFAITNKLKQK